LPERRKHPRLRFELTVALTGRDGYVSARTRDVSEGGMFIDTRSPIRIGAELHLGLKLGHDHIVAMAEVTWQLVDDHGGHCGVGVRFTSMSPHARAVLRRFLGQAAPEHYPTTPSMAQPPRPRGAPSQPPC
jgi:uncharacterized protein (TIGR02266 family)